MNIQNPNPTKNPDKCFDLKTPTSWLDPSGF